MDHAAEAAASTESVPGPGAGGWPVGTGAVGCSAGPQVGTIALTAGILVRFPALASWGIYNCRRVGGSPAWSLHAEGRAVDIRCSAEFQPELGEQLVSLLHAHAYLLQVQRVIYNSTIWDARSDGGRPYSGASPHTDHVHIEQTWAGARDTSAATWAQIPDDYDGFAMATIEDLETVLRTILAEATAPGQLTWAGTVRSTLATTQGNHNTLANIERGVADLLAAQTPAIP